MITKTSEIHSKHTLLVRPLYGDFGRLELGVLGAPCSVIKKCVSRWIVQLDANWNIAYVDADHKLSETASSAAALLYYDKISHQQIDLKKPGSPFANRMLFNDQDLIFINGNHFRAKQQIVIIHPDKSLEGKLNKLSDVALILLADGMELPSFMQNDFSRVPILNLNNENAIVNFLSYFLSASTVPVNGLVLAGGKSTRMQTDKGQINYHGKSQRQYTTQLLTPFCNKIFISGGGEGELNIIEDAFIGLGPYGGILSAMQTNPNIAWLTVACDLPYLSADTLQYLVSHRNASKVATAFLDSEGQFPEPLVTIWEPKAYPILLQFLSQGYSCPRKVLINSDIELLTAPNVSEFRNINFPEERDEAMRFFSSPVLPGSL